MATLDVSGRTLKESTGKGRVAQPFHNRLVASDLGYVPDSQHVGVQDEKKTQRHLSPNRANAGSVRLGINSMSPQEVHRGRRHVDVVHHVYSDDSKRQTGRIGLKKVVPPHQSATRSAPLENASPRPVSANSNRIRLYSAEQQARIRLQHVANTRQDLRDTITGALSNKAAEEVVELEKRIQKQLLLEEARRAEKLRVPHAVEGRARSPDLGRTSLTEVVPFAVDGASSARPHSAKVTCRKTYVTMTNLEKEKMQSLADGASPSRARFSKKFAEPSSAPREAPFDTTIASEAYPEPPAVGVAAHFPQGKSHVTYHPEVKNIDEELRKKAAARCHFAAAGQSFTFFDGNSSASNEPKRQSLRQSVEIGFKAREDAALGVKKGKMINEQKYRPTSLW